MGTKNLDENGPNTFFFWDQKYGQSILRQRFCFGMVSTTVVSLSMRGRSKMKFSNGNDHLSFKTRG